MSKQIEDLASRVKSDLTALVSAEAKMNPDPDPNAPPPAPPKTDEEKAEYKKLLESAKGNLKALADAIEAEEKKGEEAGKGGASKEPAAPHSSAPGGHSTHEASGK